MIVSFHKSLTEIYAELCIRARAIQSLEKSGRSVCQWCKRHGEDHIHDGRCSIDALSRTFSSEQRGEAAKIDVALGLIEQLREIGV